MNKAIIMCSGPGSRWANFRNSPKQLTVINGEILLKRTVSQALKLFDEVSVIATSTDFPSFGATLHVPQINQYEDGKLVNSEAQWPKLGRATILYGDVYYTDNAIKKIAESKRVASFLLRSNASKLTGKLYGEIYAFAFDVKVKNVILTVADKLRNDRGLGRSRQAGWMLLAEFNKLAEQIEIDDETEDFDYPEDLLAWETGTGMTPLSAPHSNVWYDADTNPEDMVRTCLNCGKKMTEDKCKLRCECGYFASCSDYY